jgi:flagellar hook protein FlgE
MAAPTGWGVAVSGTDLGGEVVRQILAAAAWRANLAALRTADEVQQALVSSRG